MARKGSVLTPPSVAVTTVATPPGNEAVVDVGAFNQASFSKLASHYLSLALEPAELWLLRHHRGDWHKLRMLDLGVGAGRTALTFAAVAGSYVGLDYVDEMVRLSRERVGEDENTRFMLRDARDLSCFREGEFDVVLFSCCGIDAVDHDDRLAIIRQVRRVLKPGGQFVFDVHNLSSYPPAPFTVPSTAPTKLHALYYAWKRRAFRRRLQKAMEESNMSAVRARGWGSLLDGAHDFSVSNFHIDPQLQLEETRAAGLEIVTIMDREAQPILNVRSCTSPHVWFVARRPRTA